MSKSIQKMKLEAEMMRVGAARMEMEIRRAELLDGVERLTKDISSQSAKEAELKQQISKMEENES